VFAISAFVPVYERIHAIFGITCTGSE